MSAQPALLPGDPSAVQDEARAFADVAEAIREAAEQLEGLVRGEMHGQAIESVVHDSDELAEALGRLHPRYGDTADALSVYAVQLADAQDDARAAVDEEADARATLWRLRVEYTEIQDEVSSLRRPFQDDDPRIDALEDELNRLQGRIEIHEARIEQAWTAMSNALGDRDDAAERAIRRIRDALDEFDDRLRDRAAAVADVVFALARPVLEWIAEVVTAVVEALVKVAVALAVALAVIIVVLALAALIVFLAPYIAALLGAIGSFALAALPVLLKVALVVMSVLPAVIAVVLMRERLSPAPVLEPTSEEGVTYGPDDPRYDPADPYGAQLLENHRLDRVGGSAETHVEIVQILDEHGEPTGAWRVTLPSTQDWELLNGAIEGAPDPAGDQGALNDLGSNLALMLAPDIQAPYERAVIQAMRDAGIGPDDPVLLSGWSQGGILAAKMAADPDLPFSIDAVFAAGAPIDHFDIPEHVAVVSIQHRGDVVPMLDAAGPSQRPNWLTVVDDPLDENGRPGTPHNAENYAVTADRELARGGSVIERQQQFFTGTERSHIYVGAEG
ncbi:hypothetical protein OVN20_12615 [Microcella daejeonensis]|uniref:putative T7SS-secreted protein n=1 Tax=Microcella daejeonensis TaxID=2994971 RepID=UPI0022722792|nr:hypothetical protein [Microcella daejeonensis]WAB83855.1 hypothetical protein OVN20_12615 [Microcella daejeonensis]